MTLRYHCQPDMLPIIEATLAANGYAVEVPLQRGSGGAHTMVMSSSAASVLLAQLPNSETLEIEISGVGQPHVVHLLETLPFRVNRRPLASTGERYD